MKRFNVKMIILIIIFGIFLFAQSANASRNFLGFSLLTGSREMPLFSINGETTDQALAENGMGAEYQIQTSPHLAFGLKTINMGGDTTFSHPSVVHPGYTMTNASNSLTLLGPTVMLTSPGDTDYMRMCLGVWPAYGKYRKKLQYTNNLSVEEKANALMLGQFITLGFDFRSVLLALTFTHYSTISSSLGDVRKESPGTLEVQLVYSWGEDEATRLGK